MSVAYQRVQAAPRAVSAAVGLRRCRPRLSTARGGEMRLDTCRASPQVVAAGGMASAGAREPVEDPASKVLITSSVADQILTSVPRAGGPLRQSPIASNRRPSGGAR
jgi:hypothetical protein